MRTDRRRPRLTAQQRRNYASDLAAGVPEEVVAEFDARLMRAVERDRAYVAKHFKRRRRSY